MISTRCCRQETVDTSSSTRDSNWNHFNSDGEYSEQQLHVNTEWADDSWRISAESLISSSVSEGFTRPHPQQYMRNPTERRPGHSILHFYTPGSPNRKKSWQKGNWALPCWHRSIRRVGVSVTGADVMRRKGYLSERTPALWRSPPGVNNGSFLFPRWISSADNVLDLIICRWYAAVHPDKVCGYIITCSAHFKSWISPNSC